jgi:hypothetical protein
MKRALAVVALALGACDPELKTPHDWACTYEQTMKDEQCTGGWYCARDGYCHDPDAGAALPCEKTTVTADCPSGWFCGLDGVCHDSDAGVELICAGDTDCGGGWHCGVIGHCYDRTTAGAIACRADGGDCADTYRCGVDDICRPAVDAGAIPCRYGVDSDCTNGWRCGSNGLCLDPVGEQLVLGRATIGAAQSLLTGEPPGRPLSVGAMHTEGSQQVVVLQPDGGLVAWQKVAIPMVMGAGAVIVLPPVALPPLRTDADLVVDHFAGLGFDPGGQLWHWSFDFSGALDGGPVPGFGMNGLNNQHVTNLRSLPHVDDAPGAAIAFTPGATGAWFFGIGMGPPVLIDAGRPIVDILGLPAAGMPPKACALVGVDNGSSTEWSIASSTGMPSQTIPCFATSQNKAGDVRVGSTGLVASLRRQMNGSIDGIDVFDFTSLYTGNCAPPPGPMCPGPVASCGQLCNQSTLVDFGAVHTASGPGVEIACSNGTGLRWQVLSPSPVLPGACDATDIREVSLPVERGLQPSLLGVAFPTLAPGGLNRFGVRSDGAYVPYGGTSVTFAVPWFMDRAPTFAANTAFGFLLGTGELFGSIEPLAAVVRNSGSDQQVIQTVPRTPLLLTAGRVLAKATDANGMANLVPIGFVNAPAPEWKEPIRSVLLYRADGVPAVAVTAGDTVYLAPLADAGLVEVDSVVTPSPGAPILGVSKGLEPVDAGLELSLWVGTRDGVFHAYQTLAGRWHAQPLTIELPDALVDVWTTRDGRGRMGIANGEVLSLPSGLLIAPPPANLRGVAQRFLEVCDVPFMIDEQTAYALEPGDAGPRWVSILDVETATLKGGALFDGSLLHFDGGITDGGLAVFGRYGETWRIKLDDCMP